MTEKKYGEEDEIVRCQTEREKNKGRNMKRDNRR